MITGTYRVTWKGVSLGDHAYVSFSYEGNVDVRIIPRAKGVLIHSTDEMGGGQLTITVRGIKAEENRLAIEQYFTGLDTSLELNEKGDLVVNGTLTLQDCYLESFDQDESDSKANTFTAKFVKSL